MTWTVPDQGEPENDLQAILFQSSLDGLAAGFARTGVITGCAVTQRGAGANMSVDVAAGTIQLAGTQATVASGNVTIGAADATNPRVDLVVANGSGTKSVIAGTAAASPKEATLDTTTYVVLAQVYVPANATTITTARITDRRILMSLYPGKGAQLGLTVYQPTSAVTTYSQTTSTLTAVDTTNLTLTFTATTDAVLLRSYHATAGYSGNMLVGWINASGGATFGVTQVVMANNTNYTWTGTSQKVAVTPGTTYTLQLAFSIGGGTGTVKVFAGPPLATTSNGAAAVTLEAVAA